MFVYFVSYTYYSLQYNKLIFLKGFLSEKWYLTIRNLLSHNRDHIIAHNNENVTFPRIRITKYLIVFAHNKEKYCYYYYIIENGKDIWHI